MGAKQEVGRHGKGHEVVELEAGQELEDRPGWRQRMRILHVEQKEREAAIAGQLPGSWQC